MNKDEYFTNIAFTVASKSKDPSTQVGAVIVDKHNQVVSTGYNGMVAGADEEKLTWERPMKYLLVIHAEANALLFAKTELEGCKIYVTHSPCENCLKLILQKRIREVYYKDVSIMKERSTQEQKDAIKLLIEATGATVQNINGTNYLDELFPQPV